MNDSRMTRNIGSQYVDEYVYKVGKLTIVERYDSAGRLLSRKAI